jgi:DNA-directed RNA polymerase sigma subunit (sigma70/sigma32)
MRAYALVELGDSDAINLARASGETLQDIGAAAGGSAERIRQIVSEKS